MKFRLSIFTAGTGSTLRRGNSRRWRVVGARFVPSGEKSSLVEIPFVVKRRTLAVAEGGSRRRNEMEPIREYPMRLGDPSFYRDRDCFVISKKGYGRNGLNEGTDGGKGGGGEREGEGETKGSLWVY